MERKGIKSVAVPCSVLLLWILIAFSLVDHSFAQNSSQQHRNEEKSMEKGMSFLFIMTKQFLEVIQPHKIYEKYDVHRLASDNAYQNKELNDVKKIVLYFIGYSICVAIGILFIILIPLIGCCLCCCRCCNRCGGRHMKYDPKNARYKRRTYVTCLVILNTIILFAVVCTFITNELYKKSFIDNTGVVQDLSKTTNTLQSYVDQSIKDIKTITRTETKSLEKKILKEVDDAGNRTLELLDKSVNATSLLNKVEVFGEEIKDLRNSVSNLSHSLNNLTVLGQTLESNLTNIKQQIQLQNCTNCNEIKNYVKNTEVVANFSKLDSQKAMLTKLDKALNISHLAVEAREKFADISTNISSIMEKNKKNVQKRLTEVTDNVDSALKKLDKSKEDIPLDQLTNIINDAEEYRRAHVDYVNIPWYIGLGAASILLLIVIFIYLGILFGLCGERHGENSNCCNKNVAANFLLTAVGFFFLFSWILMILVIVYFVLGGVLYTEGCRYIDRSHPQRLQPFLSPFNTSYTFENQVVGIRAYQILENCGKNYSLFNAIGLDRNITNSVIDINELNKALKNLSNKEIKIDKVSLITPELQNKLDIFKDPKSFHINISEYEEELGKKILQNDLQVLAHNLSLVSNGALNDTAKVLMQIHDVTYLAMVEEKNRLKKSLDEVNQKMNITEHLDDLIRDINETENEINKNGTKIISVVLKIVIKNISTIVVDSIEMVANKLMDNVGHCEPLYRSVFDISDTVCITFLNPLNGFWFSLGWAVIFFLPTIIFATKLASLYRCQYKRDPAHDDESYSDGENYNHIPLSRVSLGKSGPQGMSKSTYDDPPSNKYHPLPHSHYSYGVPANQSNHYPVYPPPSYPENNTYPHLKLTVWETEDSRARRSKNEPEPLLSPNSDV
ncbi:prominin-1-A isoform X3 [Octopus sinensis]|uniref:Prominin-1-A isoform X3 n=1 Tax=Octopus sinensis TaxID=2607531 RepID=A0A7E6ERI2_9MOLL|nr:prominin-1-A isoform X3 [Octopus sinensis]